MISESIKQEMSKRKCTCERLNAQTSEGKSETEVKIKEEKNDDVKEDKKEDESPSSKLKKNQSTITDTKQDESMSLMRFVNLKVKHFFIRSLNLFL
jgi:hypothetical protein